MTLLRPRRLHTRRPRSSSLACERQKGADEEGGRCAAFAEPYQYYQRTSRGAAGKGARERKPTDGSNGGGSGVIAVSDFKWGYASAVHRTPPLRANVAGVVVVTVATAAASTAAVVERERGKEGKRERERPVSRLLSRFQFSDRTHDGDSPKTTRDSDRSDEGIVSAASRRVIGNSKRNPRKDASKKAPRTYYDTATRG